MKALVVVVGLALILLHVHLHGNAVEATVQKPPTVLIATLVRNKAHTLPYFLSCLEDLNYPKDRITIWFVKEQRILLFNCNLNSSPFQAPLRPQ